MTKKRILIVEDEVAIRDMLRGALSAAGFECGEAGDIRQAHIQVVDQTPDLILLDWMLPGGNGLELIRRLKRDAATESIPVIMLTARTDEDDKISGLNTGADDYVSKPFSPRELIARINALLRRAAPELETGSYRCQGLELDAKSHRVFIDKQPLDIGPTEFRLLQFFLSHQDRVYTRAQILDSVWGGNVYLEERTVDVHIRRLRTALTDKNNNEYDYSGFVQTVRGTGYRFSPPAS